MDTEIERALQVLADARNQVEGAQRRYLSSGPASKEEAREALLEAKALEEAAQRYLSSVTRERARRPPTSD